MAGIAMRRTQDFRGDGRSAASCGAATAETSDDRLGTYPDLPDPYILAILAQL